MSSAPFQSRVFRYLSQQRLRLQDRLQIFWRQAKTTATWSAQIVLYPLYAAAQGTRLLGQQVGRTTQQIFPGLGTGEGAEETTAILPTDTPIQNTLQGILDWATSDGSLEELAEGKPNVTVEKSRFAWLRGLLTRWSDRPSRKVSSNSSSTALAHRQTATLQKTSAAEIQLASVDLQQVPAALVPAIASLQGIASSLVNRSLVLVGMGNTIYDVLSLEQQAALQHRMSWEMGTYWRNRRQQILASHATQTKSFLPASETAQKNLLPPVRTFLGLMDWMQRGPVAIATNLFQEATLDLYFGDLAVENNSWNLGDSLPLSLESLLNGNADPGQKLPHPTLAGTERTNPLLPAAQSQRGSKSPLVRTTPGVLVNPFDDPELPTRVSLGKQDSISTPAKSSAVEGKPTAKLAPSNGSPLTQPVQLPQIAPYIETDATLIGYEQHPLERLLKWLDSGMLWLEKHWELFWKWMMGKQN